MHWFVVVLGVLLVLAVVLTAAWAYQTAHRLDRLHVRYDLSWQALDSALARRAVVARAVAADAYGSRSAGRRLVGLADAAERAPREARESIENELSAALAQVDPASVPVGLVAELADGSEDFRKWWGSHTVRIHSTGAKRINHPVIGELTVNYEVLQVTSVPGVRLVTYLAEPGTSSADALDMLRSWSVTFEEQEVKAK